MGQFPIQIGFAAIKSLDHGQAIEALRSHRKLLSAVSTKR